MEHHLTYQRHTKHTCITRARMHHAPTTREMPTLPMALSTSWLRQNSWSTVVAWPRVRRLRHSESNEHSTTTINITMRRHQTLKDLMRSAIPQYPPNTAEIATDRLGLRPIDRTPARKLRGHGR